MYDIFKGTDTLHRIKPCCISAPVGLVRTVKVSNVKIGKDGKPTVESLNKVLGELSKKSGQGGKMRGAYIISDKYEEMNAYATSKMKENNNPDRKEYSLSSNNCGTFARDVIAQDDDVDNPSIWNPTPNNIVDEYIEEGNAEVKYDPKKNITSIGKGDESDAKISGGKKNTSTLPSLPKTNSPYNYIGSAGSADDYYKNILNIYKKEQN